MTLSELKQQILEEFRAISFGYDYDEGMLISKVDEAIDRVANEMKEAVRLEEMQPRYKESDFEREEAGVLSLKSARNALKALENGNDQPYRDIHNDIVKNRNKRIDEFLV